MTKFDSKNLNVVGYANQFTLWHYSDKNIPLEEILAEGFFNPASYQLRQDDLIIINAQDQNTQIWVTHHEQDKVEVR